MKLFKNRKLRYGSAATLITVIFIAAVILFNIVASMIIDRLPSKIDLTSDNLYQISDESIEFTKGIDRDINIYVIADESQLSGGSQYTKQISEIISLYPKYSDKIKLSYVDIEKHPEFANKYEETLNSYDVIIESELRKKIISMNDMIEYDQTDYEYYYTNGTYPIKGSSAEQEMTSALLYVTDDNPITVQFITTGSEEDYFSTFKTSVLEKNAYVVENVNILTEELDQNAEIVVLRQPDKDLSANEIEKLEKFLDNDGKFGKSLLYVAADIGADTPIIDEFLKGWGISVGKEFIIEKDENRYYRTPYYVYSDITNFDFAKDYDQTNTQMLACFAHPVNLLYEAQGIIEAATLVSTSDTAILADPEQEADADEIKTVGSQQSFGILAASYKTNHENNEEKSYVFAAGSEYLLDDNFLMEDTANYFLSIFNTLTGKTDGITIASKGFADSTLDLTAAQGKVIQIVFMYVIPAIVFILGIVTYIKRRNR